MCTEYLDTACVRLNNYKMSLKFPNKKLFQVSCLTKIELEISSTKKMRKIKKIWTPNLFLNNYWIKQEAKRRFKNILRTMNAKTQYAETSRQQQRQKCFGNSDQ